MKTTSLSPSRTLWRALMVLQLAKYDISSSEKNEPKHIVGLSTIKKKGESNARVDAIILEQRPSYFPDINYGDRHPFRKYGKEEEKINNDSVGRALQSSDNGEFRPIRIVFDTSLVDLSSPTGNDDRRTKIETFVSIILPEVKKVWSSTISVVPVVGNLKIGADVDQARKEGRFTNCPLSNRNVDGDYKPHEHSVVGVENADIVIYVRIDDIDCSSNIVPALPNGVPCELDQYDRPIAGTLDFCIERLKLNRFGIVPHEDVTTAINSIVHEVGHIIGMNSELFKFFRRRDGEPLTQRPFVASTVQCVNGKNMMIYKPACNTLQQRVVDGITTHFEIVTPTVLQVVRNHFNCQSLTGARLENQPGQPSNCFGSSNWESRLHLMESMASSAPSTEFILSPLTLALLEDSGWYKADYKSPFVKVNPFGHNAGCDFVTKSCLTDDGLTVPNYSKGFFCNTELIYTKLGTFDGKLICDSAHGSRAWCDLVDYSDVYWKNFDNGPPEPFQLFKPSKLGSFNTRTDYCPTALQQHSIKCQNIDQKPLFTAPYEFYGEGSRCFNKKGDVDDSICLASRCNEEKRKLEVFLGNETVECSDGEAHSIIDGQFECPKLAAVCPHFFCPNNCAGRGVCNIGLTTDDDEPASSCTCFSKTDSTDGCYESNPRESIIDVRTCGDSFSSKSVFFSPPSIRLFDAGIPATAILSIVLLFFQ